MLSVQLTLPVVHTMHRDDGAFAGTVAGTEPVLVAANGSDAAHDATCPVCRSTSQLRTLVPVGATHVEPIAVVAEPRDDDRPRGPGRDLDLALAARGPPAAA